MGLKLSASEENTIDIFLDFEGDTSPGENEKEIHGQVAGVLFKAEQSLEKLKNLTGCQDLIKMCITKPGTDTEKAVWDAILPEVETLLEFYEFSLELEKIYPKLLKSLFQTNGNLKNNLQEKQSLAKQLADIFDFVLCFDDMKMTNPFVNHNFSYYRRTLSRMDINNNKAVDIKVNNELANRISIFLSYPTPMMRVLTETTVKLKNESFLIQDQVIAGFSLMANVCLDMVEKSRFTNSKTIMVCLCGMTGSIILVDHVDALGAFHKKSTINIKGAITKLKNFGDTTLCLLNALRYTTVHLNDPETPRTIKRSINL